MMNKTSCDSSRGEAEGNMIAADSSNSSDKAGKCIEKRKLQQHAERVTLQKRQSNRKCATTTTAGTAMKAATTSIGRNAATDLQRLTKQLTTYELPSTGATTTTTSSLVTQNLSSTLPSDLQCQPDHTTTPATTLATYKLATKTTIGDTKIPATTSSRVPKAVRTTSTRPTATATTNRAAISGRATRTATIANVHATGDTARHRTASGKAIIAANTTTISAIPTKSRQSAESGRIDSDATTTNALQRATDATTTTTTIATPTIECTTAMPAIVETDEMTIIAASSIRQVPISSNVPTTISATTKTNLITASTSSSTITKTTNTTATSGINTDYIAHASSSSDTAADANAVVAVGVTGVAVAGGGVSLLAAGNFPSYERHAQISTSTATDASKMTKPATTKVPTKATTTTTTTTATTIPFSVAAPTLSTPFGSLPTRKSATKLPLKGEVTLPCCASCLCAAQQSASASALPPTSSHVIKSKLTTAKKPATMQNCPEQDSQSHSHSSPQSFVKRTPTTTTTTRAPTPAAAATATALQSKSTENKCPSKELTAFSKQRELEAYTTSAAETLETLEVHTQNWLDALKRRVRTEFWEYEKQQLLRQTGLPAITTITTTATTAVKDLEAVPLTTNQTAGKTTATAAATPTTVIKHLKTAPIATTSSTCVKDLIAVQISQTTAVKNLAGVLTAAAATTTTVPPSTVKQLESVSAAAAVNLTATTITTSTSTTTTARKDRVRDLEQLEFHAGAGRISAIATEKAPQSVSTTIDATITTAIPLTNVNNTTSVPTTTTAIQLTSLAARKAKLKLDFFEHSVSQPLPTAISPIDHLAHSQLPALATAISRRHLRQTHQLKLKIPRERREYTARCHTEPCLPSSTVLAANSSLIAQRKLQLQHRSDEQQQLPTVLLSATQTFPSVQQLIDKFNVSSRQQQQQQQKSTIVQSNKLPESSSASASSDNSGMVSLKPDVLEQRHSPLSDEGCNLGQSPYSSDNEDNVSIRTASTTIERSKRKERVARSASSDSALGLEVEDALEGAGGNAVPPQGPQPRRMTLTVTDLPLRPALLPLAEPTDLPDSPTPDAQHATLHSLIAQTSVPSKVLLEERVVEIPEDHHHRQSSFSSTTNANSLSNSRRESAQSCISDYPNSECSGVRYVRTPSVVVSDYSDDVMCGITLEEIEYFRAHRMRRRRSSMDTAGTEKDGEAHSDVSASSSCSNLYFCGSTISALDGAECYVNGIRTTLGRKTSDCSTCSASGDEDTFTIREQPEEVHEQLGHDLADLLAAQHLSTKRAKKVGLLPLSDALPGAAEKLDP